MVSVIRRTGRVDEHGDASCVRRQLAQQFQALCRQLTREKIDPCQVAVWPCQARDKAKLDRVFGRDEDDRDRRGCRPGCERWRNTSGRG